MQKKNGKINGVVFLIVFLIAVTLLMLFGRSCQQEKPSLPVPQTVEAPVLPVEKPIVEEPSASVPAVEQVPAPQVPVLVEPEPIPQTPKTKVIEKTTSSGNKGYFVMDKQYVYFGINTTTTEEIPAE